MTQLRMEYEPRKARTMVLCVGSVAMKPAVSVIVVLGCRSVYTLYLE